VRNQGTIFLGGPPLVEAATGEVVSAEELGGGDVHTRLSGVADHLAENDAHALAIARRAVATLERPRRSEIALREPREPRYPGGGDVRHRAGPIRASPLKSARSSRGWSMRANSPNGRRASARRW